jgi:acetyl esterase/lipase
MGDQAMTKQRADAGDHRIEAALALYDGPAPGSEHWTGQERRYHSALFDTEVVANVVSPSITPVLPTDPTGAAVIVAPGGAFHSLSINSEGYDPARWLADRGVAAFVLTYRLVATGDDAPAEMMHKVTTDRAAAERDIAAVAPLAAADGEAAVKLVRARSAHYGLDPDRIGFLGFSAGGNVAARVAATADDAARPSFLAPIYASLRGFDLTHLPNGTGPLFVAAASDDQLGLVPDSIRLYQHWAASGLSAELHIYHRGGHGFGLRRQALPSDTWINRFFDWMRAHELLEEA